MPEAFVKFILPIEMSLAAISQKRSILRDNPSTARNVQNRYDAWEAEIGAKKTSFSEIAIDCRALSWHHGIARYLRNILEYLLHMQSDTHYILLYPEGVTSEYEPSDRLTIHYLRGNPLIYKYISVPRYLRRERPDVYWSPTQDMPLFRVPWCRYVVTVHDLSFEHFPAWFSLRVRLMARMGLYRHSVAIADRILADSAFTQQDLINTYGITGERVTVTHIGIDRRFRRIDRMEAKAYVKTTFGYEFPYIFYVDTVRTRHLIEAFAHLCHNEWRDNPIRLVCLGKFTNPNEHPGTFAREYGIADRVVLIDRYISDEGLNHLYAGAEFFVSPSYYEGFGLTPLESLQCGTSVCVSRNTSLPEVLEDAAVYYNPYNSLDIAEKMRILEIDVSERERIVHSGARLLARYDWERISTVIHKALTEW